MKEEKQSSNNKRTLLLSVIAVIALIAIVGGATFAFFATTRNIDASTPVNTQTAISMYSFSATANETIEFNLSATEMSEANVKESVLKSDNANIYMEVASATDNETTTCTYDIEWIWDSTDKYTESDVTLPHTDGEKSYPYELSITVDGENETDLSKLTWNDNKAIVASGLEIKSTSKTPVKLTHNIEVKSYNIPVDQQKLYNKNFRAHLEVVNNSCSATTDSSTPSSTGKNLVDYITNEVYTEDGENGLYYHDGVGTYTNANLEAGDNSYRYSGGYSYPKASAGYDSYDKILIKGSWDSSLGARAYTLGYDETNVKCTEEVALRKAINDGYLKDTANNYLCFKEGCTDDEKYRIIGVIDDKVKVIKMTNINTDDTLAWNSSNVNTWEGSTMETYLNGTYLENLKNVANLDTDKLIDNTTWHVGGMEYAKIQSPNTVKDTYTAELSSTPTIERKIGLMYASEYGYAAEPTYWNKDLNDYEPSKGHDWMLTSKSYEWTISRSSGNSRYAFYDNSVGCVVGNDVNAADNGARPVFSLSSLVKLKSGSGTYSDPYIVGL